MGTLSRFLTCGMSGVCHLVPPKGRSRRQRLPAEVNYTVELQIPMVRADRLQAGPQHFISALTRPESAMAQVAGGRESYDVGHHQMLRPSRRGHEASTSPRAWDIVHECWEQRMQDREFPDWIVYCIPLPLPPPFDRPLA